MGRGFEKPTVPGAGREKPSKGLDRERWSGGLEVLRNAAGAVGARPDLKKWGGSESRLEGRVFLRCCVFGYAVEGGGVGMFGWIRRYSKGALLEDLFDRHQPVDLVDWRELCRASQRF